MGLVSGFLSFKLETFSHFNLLSLANDTVQDLFSQDLFWLLSYDSSWSFGGFSKNISLWPPLGMSMGHADGAPCFFNSP